MAMTQAPSRHAAVAAHASSATPQEERPATAKIAPESAFGAAVKNRGVLGAGEMLALQAAAGNRAVAGLVQAKRERPSTDDSARVHEAAKLGIGGGSGKLPHLERIQRSFGRHDVTGVVAHTGEQATAGAQAMGAAAFTMGNHVAFAGSADLRTAAHEAAHVVQQRAGVQLAGGVGQVGDRYERHADAVAELVMQGRPAEGALDGYAVPARAARGEPAQVAGSGGGGAGSAGGGGTGGGAIQRKIGFEFQLQSSLCWEVTDLEHSKEAMENPTLVDNHYRKRLPKPLVLLKAKGFELQADDGSIAGTSELEIVTDAFEEDKTGAKAMKNTMSIIMRLGEKFDDLRKQGNAGYDSIAVLAGNLTGFGTVPEPERHLLALGNNASVSPQVTGAIRLDKLSKVMEDFSSPPDEGPSSPDEGPRESLDLRRLRAQGRELTGGGHSQLGKGVALAAKGISQFQAAHHLDEPSSELKSLLGLVLSYLLMGSKPIDAYPKTIAPLLSRTPMHVLFGMLPLVEQKLLRGGGLSKLVGMALPGLKLGQPVFQFGVYTGARYADKRKDAHAAHGRDIQQMMNRLTRRLWLLSIPIKDLLTPEAFKAAFPDPEGAEAAAELESLGSWQEPGMVGAKKPKKRIPAGIFELRTLSKIPFGMIPALADAFYVYVVAVNQQKDAYLTLNEKL
jgi:Domain of unknown function (DUF4157)